MALAVDSEMPSNVGFSAGTGVGSLTNPQTYSFTNTAGTLLIVIVGVGLASANTATIDGVTYNGVAMTSIVTTTTSGATTGGRIGIFYLLNPATGPNTVSISFTEDTAFDLEIWSGAISFTGHNTSTPIAQSIGAHGNSTTASGSLASVAAGNITVCGAGAGTGMTGQTQTLSWAKNEADTSAMGNGRSSRSASTGTVQHDFTVGAADSWATVIVEVAAAAGAVGATLTGVGNISSPKRIVPLP